VPEDAKVEITRRREEFQRNHPSSALIVENMRDTCRDSYTRHQSWVCQSSTIAMTTLVSLSVIVPHIYIAVVAVDFDRTDTIFWFQLFLSWCTCTIFIITNVIIVWWDTGRVIRECAYSMNWYTSHLECIAHEVLKDSSSNVPEKSARLMSKLTDWYRARRFSEEVDVNYRFAGMSLFFAAQLIGSILSLTFIIAGMIIHESFPLFTYFVVGTVCVICIGCALGMSFSIVGIYGSLFNSLKVLDEMKIEFITRVANSSNGDSTGELMLFCDYFDQLQNNMKMYTLPPKVLGVSIKPTLVNLFISVASAGVVTIVGQICAAMLEK
jgi:hypothetical protein